MRFSHYFIQRPIFAAVLSLFITIIGLISGRSLAISEYPEIAPPTVNIRAIYPGASAQVIAETPGSLVLDAPGVQEHRRRRRPPRRR